MRIVCTDNFDRETVPEHFVLWPMPKDAALELANVLNRHFSGSTSRDYYKVVENDYQLFTPDF